MNYLFQLFCMYGVMFALRNAQLPGLTNVRHWVISQNSFLRKMLECSFCTGFHAGWITYLGTANFAGTSVLSVLNSMIYFGFVSAAFCYFLDTLIVKLEN
jgi:hypothetical protein